MPNRTEPVIRGQYVAIDSGYITPKHEFEQWVTKIYHIDKAQKRIIEIQEREITIKRAQLHECHVAMDTAFISVNRLQHHITELDKRHRRKRMATAIKTGIYAFTAGAITTLLTIIVL